MESAQILFYLAAFVTALVGIYNAANLRKKSEVDMADSLTGTAMKIVDVRDREIAVMKTERAMRKIYITYLLTGIAVLTRQLGETKPDFVPKTLEEFINDNQ
jgi:hypothetical protein